MCLRWRLVVASVEVGAGVTEEAEMAENDDDVKMMVVMVIWNR